VDGAASAEKKKKKEKGSTQETRLEIRNSKRGKEQERGK